MGVFKALSGAIRGTAANQWKEYFYCDGFRDGMLMRRAYRAAGTRSVNKGDADIITDGSVIAVGEGEAAIAVRNGKVIDVCTEPGEHLFQSGDAPSVFSGAGIGSFARAVGRSFAYGGDPPPVVHRIYYVNTKEIVCNFFQTERPIPFRVRADYADIDLDCGLECSGAFSFRIVDPEKAYKRLTASVGVWDSRALLGQIKTEMASALQTAAGRISEVGIYPSTLPETVPVLEGYVRDEMNARIGELRGIEIVAVGFSELTLTREDGALVTALERATLWRTPEVARLFFPDGVVPEAEKPRERDVVGPDGKWLCTCGNLTADKFCRECGRSRPADWICACGKRNTANFCTECGKKRPF